MYKIGEFARLAGLSVSTLRYYEKIGILMPEGTDPDNRYCYYDSNSHLEAILIAGMKEMGFTLKEIKANLETRKDEELYAAIMRKKERLVKERQRINALLGKIDEYLLLYEGEDHEME